MHESRFLCLAVGRRDGGNCIAGIDLDSGKWIRPVHARTHGALADHEIIVFDTKAQEQRILLPLDVMRIRLDKFAGNNVQPENWELEPASHDDAYIVLWHFDEPQDADMLAPYLDRNGPLLHTHSDRFSFEGPLLERKLSHSLSIIRPQQLHWIVAPNPSYPNRMRVQAEFRFDDNPYCLVLTDPIWEARCRRSGPGRHSHSVVAGDTNAQVFLTVSLAEVPLHGFHYKLVAGVVNLSS
jgi:hypothetical protein